MWFAHTWLQRFFPPKLRARSLAHSLAVGRNFGRFLFSQKFRNFRNRGHVNENSVEISSKKIDNKSEPVSPKFLKLQEEKNRTQIEEKFVVRNFRKMWLYLATMFSNPKSPEKTEMLFRSTQEIFRNSSWNFCSNGKLF